MNREQRAALAQETVSILQSGSYALPDGSAVSIRADLEAACANTKIYAPTDYASLMRQVAAQPANHKMVKQVSNRTTLEAAHALLAEYPQVAALNFASAKNPGGGFLSGSQAQEESLARASGLYATLQTQPAFYEFHRQRRTSFYSDHLIFSPGVPVFRDDAGHLLWAPWQVTFLTAPAVNAGAVRQNEAGQVNQIIPAMERRARMVLAVAAARGCTALVLGAWGCGVFQNHPATVAGIFATVLAEPLFKGRFAHIEFAIYDPSADGATIQAFRDTLKL